MKISIHQSVEFYKEEKGKLTEKASKICSTCKVEKDKDDFTTDRKKRDGKYPICNDCNKIRQRALYKKQPGNFYNTNRKWSKNNPEKTAAYWKVARALKAGRIVKPKYCQLCGNVGKVEAHHWKGYEEEHILDVQWLCRSCHKKI